MSAETTKAACLTPPCILFADPPHNKAWTIRVRQHFVSGDHSGELADQVAFARMMEPTFRKAMALDTNG